MAIKTLETMDDNYYCLLEPFFAVPPPLLVVMQKSSRFATAANLTWIGFLANKYYSVQANKTKQLNYSAKENTRDNYSCWTWSLLQQSSNTLAMCRVWQAIVQIPKHVGHAILKRTTNRSLLLIIPGYSIDDHWMIIPQTNNEFLVNPTAT